MVVLDKTLGSRQGTLYKAPRGSERDLKDTNAFCRNDFWALVACKPSQPLLPGMVANSPRVRHCRLIRVLDFAPHEMRPQWIKITSKGDAPSVGLGNSRILSFLQP